MIKKLTCLIILVLISFSANYPHPPAFINQINVIETASIKKAQFLPAYIAIRSWEGNYSNTEKDKGGETYGGVSRVYNPNWRGWRRLDELKNQIHCDLNHNHSRVCKIPKWNQQFDEIVEHWVLDHYIDIWFKEGFDLLDNQEVANYLFDFRIHGTVAIRLTQKVVNSMGKNIAVDNRMTPNLSLTINSLNQQEFLCRLRSVRIQFYNNIVHNHPSQYKFYKEWVKRAHKGGTIREDV